MLYERIVDTRGIGAAIPDVGFDVVNAVEDCGGGVSQLFGISFDRDGTR